MAEPQVASAAGVIHDLGYRRYDGPRLGRVQIVRALIWHSFRSAWGMGRGVKAKIIPILAVIAICLPAFANAFAVARGNARLFGYDVYDVVRDAVADLALPLCRLEQRRHQVEELFRDDQSEEGAAHV